MQSIKVGEVAARKYGGGPLNTRVGGRNACGGTLRLEETYQSNQMIGCQAGLIASEHQYAGDCGGICGIDAFDSAQSSMDGTRDPLSPCAIDHGKHIACAEVCADLFVMRAKNRYHRNRTRFLSQSQSAPDQRFPLKIKQLLGQAKALAGARGKKNGGNRHRPQCNSRRLKKNLFQRKTQGNRMNAHSATSSIYGRRPPGAWSAFGRIPSAEALGYHPLRLRRCNSRSN